MSTTTTLSVRMDSDIKKQCKAMYAELGINLTTAINVFFRQSLRVGGFSFDVRIDQPNMETIMAHSLAQNTTDIPSINIELIHRMCYNTHTQLLSWRCTMALENKLGITNSADLAREEERISKKKAAQLFESGLLEKLDAGTFSSLRAIHKYLFDEIYDFAGEVRTVNIAKGNFRFAPVMYLEVSLANIDKMPQSTFDEIVEKYVEMNIAHPFREGNGRSTRIWLDQTFKAELHKVVNWSKVDKEDYLLAMERSPIRDIEIKHVLKAALTDDINSREVYMKGIDHSYYYEGYTTFKTEEL